MVVHSDKVVTMTWQANGMPRDLTSGRLVILHFVGIPQINKPLEVIQSSSQAWFYIGLGLRVVFVNLVHVDQTQWTYFPVGKELNRTLCSGENYNCK